MSLNHIVIGNMIAMAIIVIIGMSISSSITSTSTWL